MGKFLGKNFEPVKTYIKILYYGIWGKFSGGYLWILYGTKNFNEPTRVWGISYERKKKMKNDKKKKAVLVDIDGTLVTLTDFDYGVFVKKDDETEEEKEVRVVEYLKFWDKDTLNAKAIVGGVEQLVKFKNMGYELVFLTARGQGCRKYTEMKLKEIGVWEMVDSIWHRPLRWEGKKSSLYKEAMIKMLMKKWDFEWAMDDESANLEMMERMGMKVLDAKVWW